MNIDHDNLQEVISICGETIADITQADEVKMATLYDMCS